MNWPLPGETLASRPPEMTFDTFDPLPRDVAAAVRVILGLPPRDRSGGDDVGANAVPSDATPGRDGGDTEPAVSIAAAAHPPDGGAAAKKRPAAAAVAATGRRGTLASAAGAGSDAGKRHKRRAAGGNGAGTWV